jgi:hypothetical protein
MLAHQAGYWAEKERVRLRSPNEATLHVRLRHTHLGAKQSIIRFPEPPANFPAHVHLDQRKLLEILRVDLVEVGG